jgi:lipopolysaccharide/colanic/teichoic acid biosynthesis glycosyltransferase
MTDQHDDAGELLPDVGRLSSFGRFLRSTSLDELPELWNVVKGEMSLVGPRPLPARYLPRYSAEERRRHQVRPGITGWAQVNGRNALDWNDRLAADVWYVDNQSLKLDFKIIGRTLLSVVRREGVSAPGESTMYELPHHEDRVVS